MRIYIDVFENYQQFSRIYSKSLEVCFDSVSDMNEFKGLVSSLSIESCNEEEDNPYCYFVINSEEEFNLVYQVIEDNGFEIEEY